jgi:hypothetical protein
VETQRRREDIGYALVEVTEEEGKEIAEANDYWI